MKLKEYIRGLVSLGLDEHNTVDLMECEVFYSSDDEGNTYAPVHYEPGVVLMDTSNNEIILIDGEDDGDDNPEVIVKDLQQEQVSNPDVKLVVVIN